MGKLGVLHLSPARSPELPPLGSALCIHTWLPKSEVGSREVWLRGRCHRLQYQRAGQAGCASSVTASLVTRALDEITFHHRSQRREKERGQRNQRPVLKALILSPMSDSLISWISQLVLSNQERVSSPNSSDCSWKLGLAAPRALKGTVTKKTSLRVFPHAQQNNKCLGSQYP